MFVSVFFYATWEGGYIIMQGRVKMVGVLGSNLKLFVWGPILIKHKAMSKIVDITQNMGFAR